MEAYSPIAHGDLLKNEVVAEMAEKYGVSGPQMSIRCVLEFGLLPLPWTANPAHMKESADVVFVISVQDEAEPRTSVEVVRGGTASRGHGVR